METKLRGQLAYLRQNKGWVVSRERVISWILTDGNMKTAILILDILTDFPFFGKLLQRGGGKSDDIP